MAATRSLGTLTIDLIAKTGGWTAGLTAAEREAERSSRRIKGQFNQLKTEAKTLGKIAAAGVVGAVTGATASIASMTKQGIDSVTQLKAMADQIGSTTDELTSLRYAASQLANLGEGQFDTAFRRMTRRVSEFAATGQGAAANALKQLNLESADLARLSPEDQLKLIADRMQGLATDGQRSALAFRIFGAEGQALGQAFRDGSKGIDEMQRKADDLGITIKQIDANQVALLSEATTEASAVFNAFKQNLAVEFAPLLIGITKTAREMVGEMGGMDKVAGDTFNKVITAAGFVADSFEGVRRVTIALGTSIAGMALQAKADLQELSESIKSDPVGAIKKINDMLAEMPGLLGIAARAASKTFQLAGVETSEAAEAASSETREALRLLREDLEKMWAEPLPSEAFKQFVADAQEAAKEAAAAMGAPVRQDIETDNKEQDKAREQAQKNLENLRRSLRDERQVVIDDFEERQRILQEARELADLESEEHAELLEQLTAERNARLSEIEKRESEKRIRQAQLERQQKIDALSTTFGALSTLMNSGSRKLFEVGKIAAISNSIVSTYAGATKALELGWPMGPIAAAAITVSGMANVASIGSTSFGAKTAPATSISSGLAAQTVPVSNIAAQAGGPSVQITFTGDVTGFDRDELANAIVDQMADKINNYDEIIISPSSRQAAALRA